MEATAQTGQSEDSGTERIQLSPLSLSLSRLPSLPLSLSQSEVKRGTLDSFTIPSHAIMSSCYFYILLLYERKSSISAAGQHIVLCELLALPSFGDI